MADDTSAPERATRSPVTAQRFGTIVVVGGGCYGGYYVRQLARAYRADAVRWHRLLVVDRDPSCRVAALPEAERPPRLSLAFAEWRDFFGDVLGAAAVDPGSHAGDAIVPSPLMPHLLADWIADRAAARWPERVVRIAPLASVPDVPWQRAGADGTRYVSFAEWMCPINCIEPARCPHTRGPRTWSMPDAIRAYAREAGDGDASPGEPLVFHCTHRAYGVGMIDVRDVLQADAEVAARAADGPAEFLVGTVSHCHGALRRLVVGASDCREHPGTVAD
jgi:hypothetical protein